MKRPSLPIDGGCRCRRLRFRISASPLFTGVCHCSGCQHMTGGAYATTICVPEEGFEITQGIPVIGGMHAEDSQHQHCDWCKGWTHTTFPAGRGFVNVRGGALDDPSWFEPFIETYLSEALPWAVVGAPHQFQKFPDMAQYKPLLAAFAAR